MNCAVKLSANCRNFSLEIVYFTAFGNEASNIVLSPFSLWTLMFGVRLGTTDVSDKELRRALILSRRNGGELINDYTHLTDQVVNSDSTGVTLMSQNAMVLDHQLQVNTGFVGDAVKVIERIHVNDTGLESVAEMVHKELPESGIQVKNMVILKDSNKTRMVFANRMHFKGLWSMPFDRAATTVEPFYDENGKLIGKVNMMYQRNKFPFANVRELNAFVLELPYGDDGKYCMLILLPWVGKSVTEVYENLSEFPVTNIFYKMYNDTHKYGLEHIDVRIPRFKIGTHVELIKPFNDMNVKAIFMPADAKFSRFTNESIYVSSVTQIGDIEVTEAGVVASDTLETNSTRTITTPGYTANKPFIYFIFEKTTVSMIYAGVYSKPTVY
ncbi:Serine protease inhibitor 77Ba [Eumeta japonica]|uniref:Serine protease inhibitor 77Ba n=1 Tax=Eumeta variegata TaxID=151549 RepID=A0A4C1ZIZ2_EUMVA|nr:Serine protease inhibitor 77Ba [Eumeta japonica]